MSKASKTRFMRRQVGKAMAKNLQSRSCGDCTVCCTVMGVVSIDKPVDETCKHVEGNRCGIYGSRPSACKEFHCGWRHSFDLLPGVGEEGRPDKLGVMFDMASASKVFSGGAFVVREAREGAIDAIEVDLWEIAERDGIVFFIVKGQTPRRVIASDANMAIASELVRRHLPVVPS